MTSSGDESQGSRGLGERDEKMDVDNDDASYTNVKRRGRGLNIKGRYSMIADPDDDVAMHTDGVNSKGFGRLEDEIPREDKDEMAAALTADGAVAARSIEGWVVLVTNIHEEVTEEDVMEKFLDFGEVKNCHLNLDRRTGYVKGYALLEFESQTEASNAIDACSNGLTLMEERLSADFAFIQPPKGASSQGIRSREGRMDNQKDIRARSPGRR